MANFFAPQVEYKAPTFQELAAPLAVYQAAYNDMEEKYDAQKEKAAMLQAMLGTDPDNEISNYMADYNALMDQTARGFSNGTLPYAQLYNNYKQLQNIWNDKGLKATAAIDAYTKYREAKKPGYIGPELTIGDFLRNPQRQYTFINPEDIYKNAAISGAAYTQMRGPRNGRQTTNGRWVEEYGPTTDEITKAFDDENNPFYKDAMRLMEINGIKKGDDMYEMFKNAYQRGLASNQTLQFNSYVDYINAAQRMSHSSGGGSSKASEYSQEELEAAMSTPGFGDQDVNAGYVGYNGKRYKVIWNMYHKKFGFRDDEGNLVFTIKPTSTKKSDEEEPDYVAEAGRNYFYESGNHVVTKGGIPHRVVYEPVSAKYGYLTFDNNGTETFNPFPDDVSKKYGYSVSTQKVDLAEMKNRISTSSTPKTGSVNDIENLE